MACTYLQVRHVCRLAKPVGLGRLRQGLLHDGQELHGALGGRDGGGRHDALAQQGPPFVPHEDGVHAGEGLRNGRVVLLWGGAGLVRGQRGGGLSGHACRQGPSPLLAFAHHPIQTQVQNQGR